VQKQNTSGPNRVGHLAGVGAFHRNAQLGGGCIQPGRVDVADPGDLKRPFAWKAEA